MHLPCVYTGKIRADIRYHPLVEEMNTSEALQPVDPDRRRAAPMVASMLFGALILTAVTQVSGRIRSDAPSGRALVLTGIIAYTDPKQGFAIIGGTVESTYLVRPGERLPDGSLIREIYAQHVVLEYEGRLEKVGMYKRGDLAGNAHIQIPPPRQQIQREEDADPKGAAVGDVLPRRTLRSTDEPPRDAPPDDAQTIERPDNGHRSFEPRSSDTSQKQAQPDAPLPSAQDPADELNDDRRVRSESRRK